MIVKTEKMVRLIFKSSFHSLATLTPLEAPSTTYGDSPHPTLQIVKLASSKKIMQQTENFPDELMRSSLKKIEVHEKSNVLKREMRGQNDTGTSIMQGY